MARGDNQKTKVYPLDLTGIRFGQLVPLYRVKGDNGAVWLCRCDCGAEKPVRRRDLQAKTVVSCGCRFRGKITHGGSKDPIYRGWIAMRRRCRAPASDGWKNYGGRGIAVCPEWEDYAVFREWALANGYESGLTLDRRDNDGPYAPSNCRWVTRAVQNRNRRVNLKAPNGELWQDIASRNGIHKSAFSGRRQLGWSLERAATQPLTRSGVNA